MDELRAFGQFGKELKVIIEVGILAKTQAFDQIEALAEAFAQRRQVPPPSVESPTIFEDHILTTSRQAAATMLVQTRKSKGETAADQLAEVYSSLQLCGSKSDVPLQHGKKSDFMWIAYRENMNHRCCEVRGWLFRRAAGRRELA